MKTAVLFVACVPLLVVGSLLVVDDVNNDPVDPSLPEVRNQNESLQSTLLAQKTVLPGYGTITGQILFDGDPPEPKLLVRQNDSRVKDAVVCAAHDIMAENLLVDPETNGIANAFVYIYHRNIKRDGLKIHPDLLKFNAEDQEVVCNTKGCRFIPHAMVVRAGQHVRIKSQDSCAHNPHLNTLYNQPVGWVQAPRDRGDILFDHLKLAESLPMPVKCDIHPWMKAHWLIIDHPYAAVTDKQGRFTIENLPVGEIEFRIWHEVPGYIDKRYVVKVAAGTTRLAPVVVPAAKFQE